MKLFRRWQRIFILFLLSLSVFAPIVLFSHRLKSLSLSSHRGREEFDDDNDPHRSSINQRYSQSDIFQLSAVTQEERGGVREPPREVYRDQNYSISSGSRIKHNVGDGSSKSEDLKEDISLPGRGSERSVFEQRGGGEREVVRGREEPSPVKPKEGQPNQRSSQNDHGVRAPRLKTGQRGQDSRSEARRAADEKVKQMKDQVVRARAYVTFATSSGNTHLVKELKLRIKELERAMGEARRDSELSRSAIQKIKYMDNTLSKASRLYPDCSNMVNRLRAMTHNAEDQLQSQRNQANFLTELAGRTTPKGLHCLSMRLTFEYFALEPEQRVLPKQHNVHNPDLFHYVVFSDNVLAAGVVVNSTVSNAVEPERIVFHVVTDSLNFPAFSMWFLLNPPEKATIHILSTNDLPWLPTTYGSSLDKQNSRDPRYTSPLNHLRFYLPEIFPQLSKIVFLDHDVVVLRDLSGLFTIDMKGKVNGAVETCQEGESSYRRMDTFINFSDPSVASKFDANACTWAFGVNVFDLRQWRLKDLTSRYRRFLLTGNGKPLWTAGSLPLGWLTFYDQTVSLDPRWHLLGLGYDSQVKTEDIEKAAVIHYDGIMKPWLDIGIKKYKGHWNNFVEYSHPYVQRCNLHG